MVSRITGMPFTGFNITIALSQINIIKKKNIKTVWATQIVFYNAITMSLICHSTKIFITTLLHLKFCVYYVIPNNNQLLQLFT